MGGSTGTVSKLIGAPTTITGESQRDTEKAISALPNMYDGLRQETATIREVHPEKPLVKIVTDKGFTIGGGAWVPLSHSPADIAERWGRLRKGLRVSAIYSGPDGRGAIATIIGVEDDKEGDGTQLDNNIKEGLYEIFSPGSVPV